MLRLELPSLRERSEDIRPLADALLAEWNQKHSRNVCFHPGIYDKLLRYNWPGNIRELKNAVYFAAYVSESDVINSIPLPKDTDVLGSAPIVDYGDMHLKDIMEITERNIIKEMLKKYGDTLCAKKEIANRLGISLPTLYNKLRAVETHA
jgi:transcriptional regulator with PAS, ATPase and Fis domain